MAFRVTRGSTSKLLPIAFGVSVNRSAGFTAPHVADDSTDARTYSIHSQGGLTCRSSHTSLQYVRWTAMSDYSLIQPQAASRYTSFPFDAQKRKSCLFFAFLCCPFTAP